jgi:hypothetical protein
MDINADAPTHASQSKQMFPNQPTTLINQHGHTKTQPVASTSSTSHNYKHSERPHQPHIITTQALPTTSYPTITSQPSYQTLYSTSFLPLPLPSSNTEWQVVTNKKSNRSPENENNRPQRQPKPNEYSLSNRFSGLRDESDNEANESMETNKKHRKNEPKPRLIFVTGVENINPLTSLLHTEIAGKYSTKASLTR